MSPATLALLASILCLIYSLYTLRKAVQMQRKQEAFLRDLEVILKSMAPKQKAERSIPERRRHFRAGL